jgi:hypothetical protein
MCKHFGIEIQHGYGHTSGGFRSSAFQLNLVRDIFAAVDSGYTFHKTAPEPWTKWRLADIQDGPTKAIVDGFGLAWLKFIPSVNAAVSGLRILATKSTHGCQEIRGSKLVARINGSFEVGDHTYASLLNALSLADGLMMESFRSLYRNVPFLVASTIDCKQVQRSTNGSCSSVLLDDIMADYRGSGFNLVAEALKLPIHSIAEGAKVAAYFDRNCNPLPKNKVKFSTDRSRSFRQEIPVGLVHDHTHYIPNQHTAPTAVRAERPARIELLRKLDKIFLGGALAVANQTVYHNAGRSQKHVAAKEVHAEKAAANCRSVRCPHSTNVANRVTSTAKLLAVSEPCFHAPVLHSHNVTILQAYQQFMAGVVRDANDQDPTVEFRSFPLAGRLIFLKPRGRRRTVTATVVNERTRIPQHIANVTELNGDFVIVKWSHSSVFAHELPDHFPTVAWLCTNLPASTRIVLLDSNAAFKRLLFAVDPEYARRGVLWVGEGEVLHITGTLRTFDPPKKHGTPPIAFIQAARSWLRNKTSRSPNVGHGFERQRSTSTIVFYSRTAALFNGRFVSNCLTAEENHEKAIITLIRNAMTRHLRSERLVIFDGQGAAGIHLTLQERRDLFSSASYVIGPHGVGMANILWMDSSERSCERPRPAVLEFWCTDESTAAPKFQASGYHRTNFMLYGTIPWIDYHHVPIYSSSAKGQPLKNLTLVDEALNAIFSK